VWGDSDGSRGYELIHALENPASPRTQWAPPYAALLGTFQGDWITVAERYRAWGTRQPWARESRLVRGRVPEWLLRTGMWVWNRGRSPGVVPPALALQRALGLPVNIHWHWWHHGPYDTSFPGYPVARVLGRGARTSRGRRELLEGRVAGGRDADPSGGQAWATGAARGRGRRRAVAAGVGPHAHPPGQPGALHRPGQRLGADPVLPGGLPRLWRDVRQLLVARHAAL